MWPWRKQSADVRLVFADDGPAARTAPATDGDSLSPGSGDPVELLAVGPFPVINHNQTISVDFALVGEGCVGDLALGVVLLDGGDHAAELIDL